MADFISREAEIQFFNDWVDDLDKQINDSVNCPHLRSNYKVCKTQLLDCIHAIKEMPAADVRTVVRCKDCRHRDPEDRKCDSGEMERQGCVFPVDDDYFCAYGER